MTSYNKILQYSSSLFTLKTMPNPGFNIDAVMVKIWPFSHGCNTVYDIMPYAI